MHTVAGLLQRDRGAEGQRGRVTEGQRLYYRITAKLKRISRRGSNLRVSGPGLDSFLEEEIRVLSLKW